MPIPQIMPNGQDPQEAKGVVDVPNESLQGMKIVGSSAPLGHALDVVTVPNAGLRNSVGSSGPQPKSASQVMPPNNKMKSGGSGTADTGVPTRSAPGAVPVRGGSNPGIPMKKA